MIKRSYSAFYPKYTNSVKREVFNCVFTHVLRTGLDDCIVPTFSK